MINQTTLGHRVIREQFNKVPHVGWQIDPFGHSVVQAYLLGAEDRVKRKEDKSLEVIWRGSKTFGSSSQIFSSAFPTNYGPSDGFFFYVNDDSPIQDDPLLYDYNVEQCVNDSLMLQGLKQMLHVQIISCGQWVWISHISTQSLGSRKWTSLSIMLTRWNTDAIVFN